MVLPRDAEIAYEGPPVDVQVPPEAGHDDVVVPAEGVDEGLVEDAVEVLCGAHVPWWHVPGDVHELVVGARGFELCFEPGELPGGIALREVDKGVAVVIDVGVEGNKAETLVDEFGVVPALLECLK